MNQDQMSSAVRSILKLAGAALAAHGATKAAALVNTEDMIGLVLTLVGLVWSHWNHAAPSAGNASGPMRVWLWLLLPAFALTGCAANKYQVTESTSGDGWYVKLAVPVTQGVSIGLQSFIGRFNNTVIAQPTSTNKLYTPPVVVAVVGKGKQTASGNAGTGTNSTAGIGDASYDGSAVVTGDASADETFGTNHLVQANGPGKPTAQ